MRHALSAQCERTGLVLSMRHALSAQCERTCLRLEVSGGDGESDGEAGGEKLRDKKENIRERG